ncbi:MAG TPA: hypothetical protein VN428_25865 [Bryobacteraceae bacterium]|nr:hypothetical protein [Bryobacteraceae bacterium]
MAFIRTVLGDIPPESLGACYAHEHVIAGPSYATRQFPDFLLDDADKASAELAEFRAAGGHAMVDCTPCGAGRNVVKLAAVAEAAGVHIICATGLHLEKYYPPGHWSARLDAERLAALFTSEVAEGVDRHDYEAPAVERTRHRAGVIKAAGGLDRLNGRERRAFEAAALAHQATGAPVLTHTEQGTAALEQIALLAALGVAPRHIVICHTDRRPDPAYHKEILSSGVFLEYDSAFRWPPERGNPTRDLLLEMVASGFNTQLLLGMDAARRRYWAEYGGSPGLTYLLAVFAAELRDRGLPQSDLDRIFVSNPAAAFAFAGNTSRT